MMRMTLTTGIAALFVVGLTAGLAGCPGEGEGEGEGAAGEGEGEGAGEGEGEGAGEGEGEGAGEGEGEGAVDSTCQEECATDDDCTVSNGTNIGFVCTDGRCGPAACTTDTGCVGLFSGWQKADTSSPPDFIGDVPCDGNNGDAGATAPCGTSATICVDTNGDGTGLCAFPDSGVVNCATLQQQAVSEIDVDGNPQDVCVANGADDATCGGDGACQNPCQADADCNGLKCRTDDGVCVQCTADADCTTGTLNTCNIAGGYCGCAADGDCSGSPTGEFCNTDLNICGCAGDADCANSNAGDVCDTSNGFCGCADDVNNCNGTQAFDGTNYVCE